MEFVGVDVAESLDCAHEIVVVVVAAAAAAQDGDSGRLAIPTADQLHEPELASARLFLRRTEGVVSVTWEACDESRWEGIVVVTAVTAAPVPVRKPLNLLLLSLLQSATLRPPPD